MQPNVSYLWYIITKSLLNSVPGPCLGQREGLSGQDPSSDWGLLLYGRQTSFRFNDWQEVGVGGGVHHFSQRSHWQKLMIFVRKHFLPNSKTLKFTLCSVKLVMFSKTTTKKPLPPLWPTVCTLKIEEYVCFQDRKSSMTPSFRAACITPSTATA